MRFEWDDRKDGENVRKHGMSLAEARWMFEAPMLVALDDREDYGEDRWIGIGNIFSTTPVVVFVERGDDVIRVLSLRKALAHERDRFEHALRNRLGSG